MQSVRRNCPGADFSVETSQAIAEDRNAACKQTCKLRNGVGDDPLRPLVNKGPRHGQMLDAQTRYDTVRFYLDWKPVKAASAFPELPMPQAASAACHRGDGPSAFHGSRSRSTEVNAERKAPGAWRIAASTDRCMSAMSAQLLLLYFNPAVRSPL